jgi:hypothetical protein
LRLESEAEAPERVLDARLRAVEHLLKVERDLGEVVEGIARRHFGLLWRLRIIEDGVVEPEPGERGGEARPHGGVLGTSRLRVLALRERHRHYRVVRGGEPVERDPKPLLAVV